MRLTFGEQLALDARGELEILFERALLDRRQMIQAEARERVGHQAHGLDRVAARFTDAEGPQVHAPQRGVDLFEEARHVGRRGQRRGRRLQLLTPVEQLIAEDGKGSCFHQRPILH